MFERRIPEWVRHAPTPSVRGFAMLSGCDAWVRGMLISVFPLEMYRALGDAETVSRAYLAIGVLSLAAVLLTPWATRFVPRRWVFTVGALAYTASALTLAALGYEAVVPALAAFSVGSIVVFVCVNAYVLEYVAQAELGRCETLRMFYAALGWAVGPVFGVWLLHLWEPAPFLLSAAASAVLLSVFWWLRLGDGKLIRRARAPAPNPLAYFGRFAAQPRLVAGWLFAMLRSCGWWVYIVYLPIFVIESGLPKETGGIAVSLTNACLFATPLMLRWVERRSVRGAVRTGFLGSALCFATAALIADLPWAAVGVLFAGSVFLVLLDICGGLPFLMAVKPSERTEMSAVYSSYRDISGIVSPGAASLVLLVAPLQGLFLATAAGLLASWGIAARLHPRLGRRRVSIGDQLASAPAELSEAR